MSAISTYLEYIRTKIYAKDVRTAIINAISQCYDDVNVPALQTEAMQAAVQAKIDAGEMAAYTVADNTFEGSKLKDETVTKNKLSSDIAANLETIAGVVFERGSRIAIPSAQMSSSYYLDGTGKCVNNSTYKMLKYAVTPGDVIWLYATKDSAGTYQFQSSPSVPSSLPNSNLVGYPQTVAANEPIRVPAGASWIIISAKSSNTVSGLYEYTTIRDVTDELESHISINGADISDIKAIMYVKQNRIVIPSAQVSNSYYLNADGTAHNDSSYKLLKYEVTAGDRIWIYAPSISPGVYQFQSSTNIPSSGTNPNLIGSTYTTAVDNVVTVPEGASWLIISALKADSTAGRYTYATLKSAVEQLQEDVENINDNLSLRSINGLEVEHKLDNARHAPGNPTLLTILHFSDLHGDTKALERIMSDAETLGASVDDYICTGDMVTNVGGNIASWWNPAVMTCIGNHESATYSSENGYNWTAVSMADRNTYYIAPFEAGWEIVHTAGTSYYYKDYATQKVRLIVMDAMLYTGTPGAEAETQTGWLVNLLSDAIANGLHVMIAIHSPHGGAVAVDCSFSRYGQGAMPIWSDCNTPDAVIDAVSTAITNGLHFIGYIIGHTHQDNIWDATGDGSQMMYCVTCANVAYAPQWRNSDQFRNVDNDAYNLVTIDTTNTLIKIVRGGGADIDDHMRARKAICVNYSTGEVVGEVL